MDESRFDRRKKNNDKSGFSGSTDSKSSMSNNLYTLDPSLTDLILQPKSDKIARPPNAFMLFAREQRKAFSLKYPAQTNKNISSMLGTVWKKMDQSEKDQYFQKSKMLLELHKQKYPDYVYSPRIARINKMQRRITNFKKKKDALFEYQSIIAEKRRKDGTEYSNERDIDPVREEASSPVYIPNNPQFFLEANKMPKCPENDAELVPSENPAYPEHPPPPMNSSSSNPFLTPREFTDEFEAKPLVHPQPYYPKCRCDDCEEHTALQHAHPICPSWNSYERGYRSDYATTFNNSGQVSSLKPPVYNQLLPMSSQYYSSSTSFDNNSPYQCLCWSCLDCKDTCCRIPHDYLKWKSLCAGQARNYSQSLYPYYNRNTERFSSTQSSPLYPRTSADYTYNPVNLNDRPETKQEVNCNYASFPDRPCYQNLESGNLHSGGSFRYDSHSNKMQPNEVEYSNLQPNDNDFSYVPHPRESCYKNSESRNLQANESYYDLYPSGLDSETVKYSNTQSSHIYHCDSHSGGLGSEQMEYKNLQSCDNKSDCVPHTSDLLSKVVHYSNLQLSDYNSDCVPHVSELRPNAVDLQSSEKESHGVSFPSELCSQEIEFRNLQRSVNESQHISYQREACSQDFECSNQYSRVENSPIVSFPSESCGQDCESSNAYSSHASYDEELNVVDVFEEIPLPQSSNVVAKEV